MNKRKRKQISLINTFSIGPVVLLPAIYWCLVKIQRFEDWYLILIISLPIGLLINKILILIISSQNDEITKLKNSKGFKLGHYTGAISIMLTLLILTMLNVFIIVESTIVEYKINQLGERGSGKNRESYVEVIHDNGELEKLDFGKPFLEQFTNKDKIQLAKHRSIFGLVYHDRPGTAR